MKSDNNPHKISEEELKNPYVETMARLDLTGGEFLFTSNLYIGRDSQFIYGFIDKVNELRESSIFERKQEFLELNKDVQKIKGMVFSKVLENKLFEKDKECNVFIISNIKLPVTDFLMHEDLKLYKFDLLEASLFKLFGPYYLLRKDDDELNLKTIIIKW